VQAKIVVIGRSGLPPREQWDRFWQTACTETALRIMTKQQKKIWQIRAMEEMGSEVLVLSADVSDVEQMQSVVRQIWSALDNSMECSTQPVFWESA